MNIQKLFLILLLIVSIALIAACSNFGNSVDKAQLQSTSLSPTNTYSSTVTASITPDIKPTHTATPTVIEGAMTRAELEDKIDRWVIGEIPLSDGDRKLDEVSAAPLDLGFYDRSLPSFPIFIYYELGFTVIDDDQGNPFVVSIAGFEDQQGNRFTLPVHVGALFEDCGDIFLRIWKGRQINREVQVLNEMFITPMALLKKSNLLTDTLTVGWMELSSPYRTDNACRNKSLEYFSLANEATTALVEFFNCESCTVEDMPAVLRSWLNGVPDQFSDQMLYEHVYNGTAKD